MNDALLEAYFRKGMKRARVHAVNVAQSPMNDHWCSGANEVIRRIDREATMDEPSLPPMLHDNEGDMPA